MKFLLLILVLASALRLYGLNWDQGQHLHPDERMITMVATEIHWPRTPEETNNLFTPQSPLNPKFFAYGSFPIYFLKAVGSLAGILDQRFVSYEAINLVGRFFSAFFDIGTIIILFYLGKKLINKNLGLLASFLYSISVLPIQLAHFYAVDTPLTFFIMATLYGVLCFSEKHTGKNILLVGLFFGLSLATKTSALLLIVPIGITALLKFAPKQIPLIALISLIALITFLIFEPFALIDFQTFLRQTLEQQQMTKSAFTFPYTLQYVNKTPYLYELKNIFFWGLGPILASSALIGVLLSFYQLFKKPLDSRLLILVTFFWAYFLVTGSFAIGFMRYMLPLYPLLCLFAAIFALQTYHFLKSKFPIFKFHLLTSIFYLLLLTWPLSFIHIYTQPNTRTTASEWVYLNIQPGTIIATEHWDDGLPTGGNIPYQINQLPIYDMNNPSKEAEVYQIAHKSSYIILASNRLYAPLQRIAANCQNWQIEPSKCPKAAAQYYQKLFDGTLGFTKVSEFAVYPTIPLINYPIDDLAADESFTVYDHPKIMIFEKKKIVDEQII